MITIITFVPYTFVNTLEMFLNSFLVWKCLVTTVTRISYTFMNGFFMSLEIIKPCCLVIRARTNPLFFRTKRNRNFKMDFGFGFVFNEIWKSESGFLRNEILEKTKFRSKPKFYWNFGKNPNFSETSVNIAEISAKIILFTFSMQPNIVAYAI